MIWIFHNDFTSFLKIIGSIFAVVSWFDFVILCRNPVLIKICSVFSFLISLVADPSFPLYLIVSCGKFFSFQGFWNYCLHFLVNQQLKLEFISFFTSFVQIFIYGVILLSVTWIFILLGIHSISLCHSKRIGTRVFTQTHTHTPYLLYYILYL